MLHFGIFLVASAVLTGNQPYHKETSKVTTGCPCLGRLGISTDLGCKIYSSVLAETLT